MEADNPRLRSISELLNERFFVPTYQRGFRWTARQVEALLDDLEAFQLRERAHDSYYCLQPIVVCRRNSDWELVDGQQRLTTIFLILRALEDVAKMLGRGRFELTYETRNGSAAFLSEPTAKDSGGYIDFHFMFEAFEAINRWFNMRDGVRRLDLLRCLTGPNDEGPNVRVIWYELEAGQNPGRAFVRLNVDRIPLTSAELIRALLLRSDRPGLKPRDADQIAQDWDSIEHRLQEDAYWYFLQSNTSSPPARIEYLFDIFVRTKLGESLDTFVDDPLATFLEFQRLLDARNDRVWSVWLEFKRLTQTLEDWFEERRLYHLVGFLVATAPSEKGSKGTSRRSEARVLVSLYTERQKLTATEYDRHLRQLAWKRFARSASTDSTGQGLTRETLEQQIFERIEELEYGKAQVSTALLLFNIGSLLQQTASTQRFQFDGYKTSNWDIEHVRSVAEFVPPASDRRRWLKHARDFVCGPVAIGQNPDEAQKLKDAIDSLVEAPSQDEAAFGDVFARVRLLSGEPEARAEDNGLSNLVLLDMGTNRSYKNAIFPVKRARIIDLDKNGQFVPPATRNVFLKYYSPNARQLMLWDDTDEVAYGQAIRETLVDFFVPMLSEGTGT